MARAARRLPDVTIKGLKTQPFAGFPAVQGFHDNVMDRYRDHKDFMNEVPEGFELMDVFYGVMDPATSYPPLPLHVSLPAFYKAQEFSQ